MKILFVSLSVIALSLSLSARTPAANSIEGKWQARFAGSSGEPISVVFDLKAKGAAVIGTVTSWQGSQQLHQLAIENGKIHGNNLTFGTSYMVPFLYNRFGFRELANRLRNWGTPTNTVTGIVNQDSINFSQMDWRGDTMVFVATRSK